MLAMHYQLEQSQWWSPQEILQQQFRQLARVLAHAYETVPFYRDRFQKAGLKFTHQAHITPDIFTQIPLLGRSDIQLYGESLLSRQVPSHHGKLIERQTSGSTGKPVRTIGTGLTQFFWSAFTLRDHLWHKRDLTGKLASVRTTVKDSIVQGWGLSTDMVFNTGQCAMMNIRADISTQAKWLEEQNPDYLLSHPSNIYALAQRCKDTGIKLPNLKEVRTLGEIVTPDLRTICREVWGVKIADIYSAQEVGYIALQCPDHEHYHIQSENVLVEILNEQDRNCAPGEIGRVVITPLHNFAMPLIRYEILDYAERGSLCQCGRGLPVLKRIMGRQRNLVTLPGGKQHWPSFPAETWASIAPIRQIQLVQKEIDFIVARVVADRRLSAEEEKLFVSVIQERLGYPFRITLEYPDQIGRSAGFKYEDFISEISG